MIALILTLLDLFSTIILGAIIVTSPCLFTHQPVPKIISYSIVFFINLAIGIFMVYTYWFDSKYRKNKLQN